MSNLADIRKKLKISQSELAKIAGLKVRLIRYYEQGGTIINKASAETLLKLAQVLDCTIEDLMETEPGIEEKEVNK